MKNDISKCVNWIEMNKGKYYNVEIAGQIFGGRYGESPQKIKEVIFHGEGNSVILQIGFSGNEKLEITNPGDCFVGQYGELNIRFADKVTFGYYYYGRPQLNENWCTKSYVIQGKKIFFEETRAMSSDYPNPTINEFSFDGMMVRLV